MKERIEKALLTQEKVQHKEKLEAQRKAFRKVTTLKTWPLQELAMEHLDHLLENGKSSLSQFHGGEYLSSESSSSTGSAEQGGKRRLPVSVPSPQALAPEEDMKDILDSSEALWSQEPRIFATEKAQGKRKYLVGHFGRIADWYWRKSINKHLYEVIRQQTPCRLYFDLEYAKEFNEGIDEETLLEEFYAELAAEFKEHYGVKLEKARIIDLDSSTVQKFSRHWIIDLDDEGFFEDAPTAGRFVKRLVTRLAEEQGTNQLHDRRPILAKHLFVQTKESSKPSCFIDLGVYTRNRLFRCYGSSKFGKPNILKVASTNQYPLISLPGDFVGTSQDDEMSSSPESTAQTSTLDEYIVANDWRPHATILASTLIIPLGGSEGRRLFRVDDNESTVRSLGSKKTPQPTRSYYDPVISIHTAKSPMPTLENFVLDVLARRGGTQGAIRAWSMEYGGSKGDVPLSITFQMCRNRYCELVGRPHKSNNIFWTVIFETWTCMQGCHDPDCFGRGSPLPIRQDYLGPIQEEYQAWRDDEFEKALMSLNLDEVPSAATNLSTRGTFPYIDKSGTRNEAASKGLYCEGEDDSDAESAFLSDEALLEAIETNPELFP